MSEFNIEVLARYAGINCHDSDAAAVVEAAAGCQSVERAPSPPPVGVDDESAFASEPSGKFLAAVGVDNHKIG